MKPKSRIALRGAETFLPRLGKSISKSLTIGALALTSLISLTPTSSTAESFELAANRSQRIVISNDRGGLVGRRAAEIAQLRRSGQAVEITGSVCLSTCTMYLGLPDVCVNPSTTFGFHGPTYWGASLSSNDFEYWSRVIASHYPAPLANWYMQTGRYKTNDLYRMRGSDLIRLGVPSCGYRS